MQNFFLYPFASAGGRTVMAAVVCSAICLLTSPASGQSTSQRLFARMWARFASNDSMRQALAFSYDLHLASTFYLKNDSAQVREDWHISQTSDSIRARLVLRQTNGKAEVVKQYEPPVKIASVKRDQRRQPADDPLMAAVLEVLQRIKNDSKSQMMIDGETTGPNGAKNYVMRFLANDRTGSIWINAQTAAVERLEWTYGKSSGLSSSGEKSSIELAPAIEQISFPVKLVFNERARTLLRRTGAYTEIATKNFQREDLP